MIRRAADVRVETPHFDRLYLPHVADVRARMDTDPSLKVLLRGSLDLPELLGFLLNFSALGFRMVEQAEIWIRRAGHACIRTGRLGLGADIVMRAVQEAGQDQLMIDDLFELAWLWRERLGAAIDVEALLAQPPPEAVLRYAELHERVIAGPNPWAQLGIDLEIENMATVIGPPLLERCCATLGRSVLRSLTFMRRHVDLDAAHAQSGVERLEGLLAREPELGLPIAQAGARALAIYLDFLGACVDLGRELAFRARARGPVSVRQSSY